MVTQRSIVFLEDKVLQAALPQCGMKDNDLIGLTDSNQGISGDGYF